jgi:hypothetical protein
MTNTTPDPDWLVEGGPVAALTGGVYGFVDFATIERVTKTRVILDDGRCYQRGGSYQQIARTAEQRRRPETMLRDPADPRVVALFARAAYRRVLRAAQEPATSRAAVTVEKMTPEQVREALLQLQDAIMAAIKEIDRRAGL